MKRLIALSVLALSCLCLLSMSKLRAAQPNSKAAMNDKAEIQGLLNRRAKALHDKDIDACMSVYAPDVVAFDIVPPLQCKGVDTYRSDYRHLFDQSKGSIDVEMREVSIATSNSIAFSYYLEHMSGSTKSGNKVDLWLRCSDCYSKIDGKWLVVHEHISVPTEFDNGKAVMDLKP